MPAFSLNLEISRTTGMREARIYMKRLAEDGVTEEAVPLAGWSAFAEARKTPDQSVVVDFQPVIEPDDADGLVTLPAMSHTAAADLPLGGFPWDLILEQPDGTRLPPVVAGVLTISRTTTNPEA